MAFDSVRGSLPAYLRARAPLLLSVGFYLGTLGLVGTIMCVAILAVVLGNALFPKALVFLLVGAAYLIVVALTILLQILPHTSSHRPWPVLTRQEEPGLFGLLDQVASATGQRVPDAVYLIPEANAWATRQTGIFRDTDWCEIGVGLTLMTVLTVEEFQAVLGHEFGHLRAHNRPGHFVFRTRIRVMWTIAALQQHVLQWIFVRFGRLYLGMTREMQPHQERLADALAASTAGRQALNSALMKIHSAGAASLRYWSTDVSPVLMRGFIPPLADGFRSLIRTSSIATSANSALETDSIDDHHDSPYITHPPLADRLQGFSGMSDVSVPDSLSALALLADPTAREVQLVRTTFKHERLRTLQPVTWPDVAAQVYVPWYADISLNYRAWFRGVMLADLPPRARDLAAALGRPPGEKPRPESLDHFRLGRGAWLLGVVASAALVRAGWTIVVRPGDPVRLAYAGITLEPFTLVAGAMEGGVDPNEWLRWCDAHGVRNLPLESGAHWVPAPTTDSALGPLPETLPSPPQVASVVRGPAEALATCSLCKVRLAIDSRQRRRKVTCWRCGTRQRLPG